MLQTHSLSEEWDGEEEVDGDPETPAAECIIRKQPKLSTGEVVSVDEIVRGKEGLYGIHVTLEN